MTKTAEKHGGEAAVKSIQRGTTFAGAAIEAQRKVENKLETSGLEAIVQENAIRLQAACDLYFNACMKAAEDSDITKFDGYIARYAWLAGCALRAWGQVKTDRKAKGKLSEVLDAYSQDDQEAKQ